MTKRRVVNLSSFYKAHRLTLEIKIDFMCHGQKSRHIENGHPTFDKESL